MSFERSDLHERLPLFEEYRFAVGDTTRRDYNFIDPTILSMMNQCVPVGLREDHTLAIPKSYEPEDGPPVLILRPGESVTVRYSDGMEKAMQRVFKLADVVVPSSFDFGAAVTSDGTAWMQSFSVPLVYPEAPEKVLERLNIPQYVGLRPQALPTDCVSTLVHECDHWDFFLNTAPLFSLPDATALPTQGKNALAEKRAHKTEYTRLVNTGQTAYFMTAEDLADDLSGLDPAQAAERARKRLVRSAPSQNHMATIAVALSLCFADTDPNIVISEQEIEAYCAAKLM